jgi:uncharacterized phage infection (PIP) family protein YhgE
MGETTTEVKARLTIETDGEPEAFTTAAQGIADFAGSAGSATASADTLAAAITAIGSALAALPGQAANFAAPIIAELDRVIAKAHEARAALDSLTGGEP